MHSILPYRFSLLYWCIHHEGRLLLPGCQTKTTQRLKQVRYRAEVAGRQGYAHNYESVSGAHDFLDKVRPRATSQAEALVTVDPSLSPEEAECLADESGTTPSSPIEPHSSRTRKPDNVEGS